MYFQIITYINTIKMFSVEVLMERTEIKNSNKMVKKSVLEKILRNIVSNGYEYAFVIDGEGLIISKGSGKIPDELAEEASLIAKMAFLRLSEIIDGEPTEVTIPLYGKGKIVLRPMVLDDMLFTLVVRIPHGKFYKRFLSRMEKDIRSFLKGA